jgi:UDP-N-acetylglucosamine--N-acetylmuramyl-(pentapeptide) pyrophosphoryl-undecaprenol N-acetylglucosamine transferase
VTYSTQNPSIKPDVDVNSPADSARKGASDNTASSAGTLRIAVAGGGSGGHLFPALAVLKALRGRLSQLDVVWLTTTRPMDSKVLSQNRVSYVAQPVRPFSSKPWHWPGFWLAWRRSVALATQTLRDTGMDVLLATGGYGSGPAIAAAAKLGMPVGMLNPDATPGLANRTMGKNATKVFAQWETTLQHFKPNQAVVAGCPIREEFLTTDKAKGCEIFGLDANRPVLLVNGGSQGSRNINLAMLDLADWMTSQFGSWQILHVTGQADFEQVQKAYSRRTGWKTVAFTSEMPAALAACDLAISRAGASTLAEITACGKPSILIPFPYDKKRHQYDNAAALVKAGAAAVIDDRLNGKANATPLKESLQTLLGDEIKRARMADASRQIGKPEAAQTIADTLLAMAEQYKQKTTVSRMIAGTRKRQ